MDIENRVKAEMAVSSDGRAKLLIYVKKIIKYVREMNYEKLSQYMTALRSYTSIASKKDKYFEMAIRVYGGIQAISLCVKKIVDASESDSDVLSNQAELLITCLTVLGNAFAVDFGSRKEMVKSHLPRNLQSLLTKRSDAFNPELVCRSLTCLGNLLNDTEIQARAIRIGLMERVFLIIDQVHQEVKNSIVRLQTSTPTVNQTSSRRRSSRLKVQPTVKITTIDALPANEEAILTAALRCIRICAMDEVSKSHFCRPIQLRIRDQFSPRPEHGLNSILEIGGILLWPEVLHLSDKLNSEIMYALAILTDKLSVAASEILEEITQAQGIKILRAIMSVFSNAAIGSRTNMMALRVLTNLVGNKKIAFEIIPLGLYDVLFRQIHETTNVSILEYQVNLFQATVTKGTGEGLHATLMPFISVKRSAEHNICSTLKILTSDAPQLIRFRRFLLQAYEGLSESCQKALCDAGLLQIMEDILYELHGRATYDDLSKRIEELELKLDTGFCSSHCRSESRICHFAPPKTLSSCTTAAEVTSKSSKKSEENKAYSSNSVFDPGYFSMSPASLSSSSPSAVSGCSDTLDEELFSPPESEDESDSRTPEMNVYDSPYKTPGKITEGSARTPATKRRPDTPDTEGQSSSKRLKMTGEKDPPPIATSSKLEENKSRYPAVLEHLPSIKTSELVMNILRKIVYYEGFVDKIVHFAPLLLSLLLSHKVHCINYDKGNDDKEAFAILFDLRQQTLKGFQACAEVVTNIFFYARHLGDFLQDNIIPIVYKIMKISADFVEPELGRNEGEMCSAQLCKLLPILSGIASKSAGYRESVMIQSLRQDKPAELQNKAAIAIPLIYNYDDARFRKFQSAMKSWDRLLKMFENVDNLPDSQFQDAVLALSCLYTTVRIPFTECNKFTLSPKLNISELPRSVNQEEFVSDPETELVTLELDDNACLLASKDILVRASPVLAAMLKGSFIESEEQRVKLHDVSRSGLEAFLEQLERSQTENESNSLFNTVNNITKYDVSSLFDVLQLAHRYVLPEIYSKTLNTIIACYLCPYTAPTIYEKALHMSPQEIWGTAINESITQLNYLVLRYILVEPKLSMRQRTVAMKQIFNLVEPEVVVKDLTDILLYYSRKHQPLITLYTHTHDL